MYMELPPKFRQQLLKLDMISFFEMMIRVLFGSILLFMMIGIVIGVARLFFNLGNLLMSGDITNRYIQIISEVLTMFILVELSRSLMDYFTAHRLRMTFIVDAGIVYVLREIMINLFEHKISNEEIYALTALLLVLGALRIGSILVYQREKIMLIDAQQASPPKC